MWISGCVIIEMYEGVTTAVKMKDGEIDSLKWKLEYTMV
jgi:hypothetical protein